MAIKKAQIVQGFLTSGDSKKAKLYYYNIIRKYICNLFQKIMPPCYVYKYLSSSNNVKIIEDKDQ